LSLIFILLYKGIYFLGYLLLKNYKESLYTFFTFLHHKVNKNLKKNGVKKNGKPRKFKNNL